MSAGASSKEPRWLRIYAVIAIHAEQISEHGGSPGIRDRGLLESALARPRNFFNLQQTGIQRLAAAYATGIIRNHPFIDGNKRTGFLAMYTFLAINGFELTATEPETVAATLSLAAGELTDEQFAAWLFDHSASVTASARSSGS